MINVLPANELQASFEIFCQLYCQNKVCGQCHLHDFIEKALPSVQYSTETAVGLNNKIIAVVKSTRTGDFLLGVGSQGRFARVVYAHAAEYKTTPTMISTILRLLIKLPVLSIIEVQVGNDRIVTSRERAEQLLSGEVIDAVKEDLKLFWDYFRFLLTDEPLAEKLYRYLAGENNDAPMATKKARRRN
jgi:hypothetical protein